MGRRWSDYISLEESGVKEWNCFKKERGMSLSQEGKPENTKRKEG